MVDERCALVLVRERCALVLVRERRALVLVLNVVQSLLFLLSTIFGCSAHLFCVSCRVPSYDPFRVLLCLVSFSNERSLFHLNSSCQQRARGICGLGQKQLFWVIAERPREGSFTVGGEEGYNVRIRLYPGRECARFVFSLCC